MGSKTEVLVFTDTNLDTHLVVSVHPEITAGDFKRKLKIMHSNCFPESGEIEVCGLMVKKKSRFYHLPDSIPIKCAFLDVRGDWFIQVEARSSNGCDINGNSETKDCVTSSAKQHNFKDSKTCPEEVSKPLPIWKNRESEHGNEKECLNGDAKTNSALKEVEAKTIWKNRESEHGNEKECLNGDAKTNSALKEVEAKTIWKNRGSEHGNEKECLNGDAKTNSALKEVEAKTIWKNRGSEHGNEKECLNGDAKTNSALKEVEAKDQWGSSSMVEVAPTEMSSGVKSVTSIINRYFPCSSKDGSSGTPTSSEVTSNIRRRKKKRRRTKRDDNLPNLLPPPVPKKSPQGTLGDNLNGDEIGKRFVIASSNLGISPIYRCRLGNGKVMGMKPCSSVSRSVFEISESDE